MADKTQHNSENQINKDKHPVDLRNEFLAKILRSKDELISKYEQIKQSILLENVLTWVEILKRKEEGEKALIKKIIENPEFKSEKEGEEVIHGVFDHLTQDSEGLSGTEKDLAIIIQKSIKIADDYAGLFEIYMNEYADSQVGAAFRALNSEEISKKHWLESLFEDLVIRGNY
ncbi:MAG: hypothetical protein LVQ97_02030 [Candidatus Micrarchaeales archaeon]|jgi:hypothetical protein|nr:hypothetical protein [Candidatus Micrarchaeales archaeon]